MELAQAMEAAERNARSLKRTEPAIKKVRSRVTHRMHVQQPCTRCGKPGHMAQECRFKEAECHTCGKRGHIAPACRSKPQARSQRKSTPGAGHNKAKRQGAHLVQEEKQATEATDSEAEDFPLFKFIEPPSNPIEIQVKVGGQDLIMEVDTGAAVSIISKRTCKEVLPHLKLRPLKVTLKTYTDQ